MRKNKIQEAVVSAFSPLSAVSEEIISSCFTYRNYEKGETVFSPDEPCAAYTVVRGKVKVYELSRGGREYFVKFLNEGDLIYAGSDDQTVSYSFGAAYTDSIVGRVGKEGFLQLLTSCPDVALRLLSDCHWRLTFSEHRAVANTYLSVTGRLALLLLDLRETAGSDEFRLPVSMKEIATMLGATPETLSRKTTYLQEIGCIRKQLRTITVLDAAKLEALAEDLADDN